MQIIHVFRSPLGGLFRHVEDVSLEQVKLGHGVGIVCAAEQASPASEQTLSQLAQKLPLGVHRLPMARQPHPSDIITTRLIRRHLLNTNAAIVHGHGAKGGLYARLSNVPSIYTPHGGSLHFSVKSPAGLAFIMAERALARRSSGFIFVCNFEKNAFREKIGFSGKPSCVVYNGLRPEEFQPVPLRNDATDVLFVGEMRKLKGVDILLDALARLKQQRVVTATLVGDGPELPDFKRQSTSAGLDEQVKFTGRLPMREALTHGRILVLASRHESFPYVILEAAAAGRTVIASDVGGIREILPAQCLFEAGNAAELAQKIALFSSASTTGAAAPPVALAQPPSVAVMAREITQFYDTVLG
jgi:glycosyltransferase involved in cell wall biosynthesis